MKEDSKPFLVILKKIKLRMSIAQAINDMFFALTVMLVLAVLISIIARFIPVYNLYGRLGIGTAAVIFITLIVTLFKAVSTTEAALKADSLGLQERTVTALELMEDDSPFSELQKQDALEYLKGLDYKKHIRFVTKRRYIVACSCMLIFIFVSAIIPNQMKDIAIERHNLSELKKQEAKKITKVEKELAKNEKLTPTQKEEVEKKLTELKRDLKEAKSEKEIDKAVEKADKKLELVKEKYNGEDLKKISDALAKNEATKNLADLINSGKTEALKESLKVAAQEIKNLSKEQLKELAENLSKAAEELKNNEELKQALAELSQKLSSGQLGDINKEMEQFANNLQELMNSEDFQEALAQAQSDLNQGQNEGEGGAMSAQGGNQGNQGGNQPGSSNQEGQGAGGSGVGSGTDMGQENPTVTTPQATGLNKKDGSEKKNGEYEKIFTSRNLGGEGEKSQITGKKNNNGSSEKVTSEKGVNVRGEDVPYNQVIGNYREMAAESMGNSEIPEGMKEIIKNYFTSLEE